MSDCKAITEKIKAIDVSDIVAFTKKIRDIGSLNKMMAPVYLRDFIIAFDITSAALAKAVQYDIEAKAALERIEAIAYLDKAGDYLKDHGLKDSVEARKMYVSIDRDVMEATDTKAQTEAMVSLLKNKLQSFRLAHDDVKKIVYGSMELSGFEGM